MAKIKRRLYIIRNTATGEVIFNYLTPAGNPKKAFFNKLEHAEKVAKEIGGCHVDCIE